MALIENQMYSFDYKNATAFISLNFGAYCKKTNCFIFGGNKIEYPFEDCSNIRIQGELKDSENELVHSKKYEYTYKNIKFKGRYSASKESFITKEKFNFFSRYIVEHDARNCSKIKELNWHPL